MATDPRYMSFDHQYVETVSTSATIAAHRFVTRAGAYPANDGDFAAGVTIFDAPGQGQLTAKGYQVDDGSTLVYEGQLNPSTTPAKPGVFPYQGLLSVVTEGIAIVEVDESLGTGDHTYEVYFRKAEGTSSYAGNIYYKDNGWTITVIGIA